MSYDFLMMKPKGEVQSQDDRGEDTLDKQDPDSVVSVVWALFPATIWSQERDGSWFGWLDGEDAWYEFLVGPASDHCWSIRTSHLTNERNLVPSICKSLDLVAFDGQAMIIVGPDWRRPALGQ